MDNISVMKEIERVKAILEQADLKPRHSLGQNFLVQTSVVQKIVTATGAAKADLLLEIGPGIGALTPGLAATAGQLIALEIDHRLLPLLAQNLAGLTNVTVLHADALQVDLAALVRHWSGPVLVTASLPYYITTPLLEKLLCQLPACRQLCLLVQKEAADRLLAQSGSKEYGPAAVLLALAGRTRRLCQVPANAFYPRPRIRSQVILSKLFTGKESRLPPTPADRQHFLQFLKSCFRHRRKKLLHNLPPGSAGQLQQLGLDQNIRAEELQPADFQKLWQLLYPSAGKMVR